MVSGRFGHVDAPLLGAAGRIEALAGQASARLQGQPVENTIDGHVAAFSTIAVDESQLVEDAAFLWPSAQVTVSRLLSGSFHGHAAQRHKDDHVQQVNNGIRTRGDVEQGLYGAQFATA